MSSIDKVNVGGTIYDIKDSNVIDDTSTSNDSTWSSSKINQTTSANKLTSRTDLTNYNSVNNEFTIPKDGYITINTAKARGNYASISVKTADGGSTFYTITISAFNTAEAGSYEGAPQNALFVKAEMKCLVSDNHGTNNELYYLPLEY